jgi:hypothetical protein
MQDTQYSDLQLEPESEGFQVVRYNMCRPEIRDTDLPDQHCGCINFMRHLHEFSRDVNNVMQSTR